MLQTALEPSCMNRATVFEWHKRFMEDWELVRDDERCGRSKKVNTTLLIGQRVRPRVTMCSHADGAAEWAVYRRGNILVSENDGYQFLLYITVTKNNIYVGLIYSLTIQLYTLGKPDFKVSFDEIEKGCHRMKIEDNGNVINDNGFRFYYCRKKLRVDWFIL